LHTFWWQINSPLCSIMYIFVFWLLFTFFHYC
jgi:hypothetical protein